MYNGLRFALICFVSVLAAATFLTVEFRQVNAARGGDLDVSFAGNGRVYEGFRRT
jgi:hypothetical protein